MDSQVTDQLPLERSESGGGAVKPSGEDKKFFIAVQCKTEEPGEMNLKIIYVVPGTRLRRILTRVPRELGQPLYDDYSVWVQVPLGADEKRMIYDCEGDFTTWLQLDSKVDSEARLENYWSLLNTSITTHKDAKVAVSNGTITTLYIGPPPSVPVPTPTQEEEEETEETQEQPTSPEPSSSSSGRKRRVPPVDYSGMDSKRFKSLTSMK
jgi:hypothetical protein